MKKHLIYIIGCSALLASCNLYKSYERPAELPLDGLYRDTIAGNTALSETDTLNFGTMPWREVFTDARLQSLIEKALTNNADMQKAELTYRRHKPDCQLPAFPICPP